MGSCRLIGDCCESAMVGTISWCGGPRSVMSEDLPRQSRRVQAADGKTRPNHEPPDDGADDCGHWPGGSRVQLHLDRGGSWAYHGPGMASRLDHRSQDEMRHQGEAISTDLPPGAGEAREVAVK